MSKYRKDFKLTTQELDLIEAALRSQMSQRAITSAATAPQRAREIRELLGKLHHQKIFYSHAGYAFSPNG